MTGSDVAFMRFDMTSLVGRTVTSVKLRINTASAGSAAAHNVKHVGSDVWSELYMSFNNAIPQSSIGATLGTLLAPLGNTWYEVSLPVSSVQGDTGNYASFAIDASTADALLFYSRESGATAPQLIVSLQ